MEFRNALERISKCIPIFMILILGFVMRCELFHATIYNELYAIYSAVNCSIAEGEYESFIQSIRQLGDNGQGCIVIRQERQSELDNILIIYTNSENNIEQIEKESDISEGRYESLLSGMTSIQFRPIEELTEKDFNKEPYILLLGDSETVYDNLKDSYSVTHPEKIQGDETDMIVIIWGLVSIFVILVNLVAALRKKKEMIIRAVYGEDLKSLTIKAFVLDLIIYQALYFFAKIFVFNFVSGDYRKYLAFGIYEAGCVIAASMNFLWLKNDTRAVFSNVQMDKGMPAFLNLLKMTAFAAVLFTIVTNLSSISTTMPQNKNDEFISECNQDLIITINGSQNDLWNQLYDEYYDEIKPKVCSMIAGGRRPVLIMNENASVFLPEELDSQLAQKNTEDIIVFVPYGCSIADEDVEGLLGLYRLSGYKWEIRQYDKGVKVPCITDEELVFWTNVANPVIIYCTADVRLSGSVFGPFRGAIYGIDKMDWNKISCELGFSDNGCRAVITNAGDVYKYQMSFIRRMVEFLSSLCILALILDLAIAILLCNMEFRNAGMEHAIKKVVGYSFFQRNRAQLAKLNLKSAVVVLIMAVMGAVTQVYNPVTCIITGGVIMLMENFVLAAYIIKYEKISVVKMLKGGCL